MTFITAKTDGKLHEFELNHACQVIEIPIEHKNATLIISTATNTKDLILTNTPFKTCEDLVSLHYPEQAYHKQEKIAFSKEYNILETNYLGGKVYLHLLPETNATPVKASISVSLGEVTPIPTPSSGSTNIILRLIGTIFIVAAVGFAGVVCYYRYHYKNYNVKPFNAPVWCPNFLFPKNENKFSGKFISLEPTGFKDNEYEPPIPVL